MAVQEYCLGLEALGQCSATSGPLLSIGEALLLSALIFGFYRWSGATASLRWRMRRLSVRLVLATLAAAVALVFLAAILRMSGPPWTRVAVIGYPVFWELVGAVLLTAAGMVLGGMAFKRAQLTERNADVFLADNKSMIAQGDEKTLRELGDEIAPAIAAVTAQCRAYRDREKREGPAEPDAFTRVCFELLETWSDARFCNVLVCWCDDTVMAIVKELTEHAVHGDGAALGSQLVDRAVADERSLLYREARKTGLRRNRAFLKAVFGEWAFVGSAVRPLASWNVYRDAELSERKIKRWGEAIDAALGAFIENGEHGEAVFRIRPGLEALNHVCAVVLARREQNGAPWSAVHDQIYEIASVFRLVVKRIRTCKLPAASETTIDNYDPLQDETLHGAIAEELFQFIGLVCASDDHDFLDWISMGPWKELFEEGELTGNLRALQVRLAYHLTLKIDDNLDPQRRFPPPVMRMLLVRYPLSAPDDHPRAAIAKELERSLLAGLKEHFPALWKAHRAFAQSILPGNTDYDDKRAVIRIRHPRRDTQVIPLEKPMLRDSASEGVA